MRTTQIMVFLVIASFSSRVCLAEIEPPPDWGDMEVEAKWGATRNAFERIINELEDGTKRFGYSLDVRWSGIPRKFVDYYYDINGELSSNLHSLRHRTRFTSKPRSPNRVFSTLVNAEWSKDWERIQYKNTPLRIEAVWFRKEVGDCRIWDQANTGLCPDLPTVKAEEVITDSEIKHGALAFMNEEHPKIDRKSLKPFMVVTDFRYRVVFKRDGKSIFEVSLDNVFTQDLRTEKVNSEFEVELEIISAESNVDTLNELYRVTRLLQDRYDLIPSTRSKGGNDVPVYQGQ